MEKSADAFRTISEVSAILETPAHVLRFWESRFPQIKPVKRAGGRRYYRPSDVALLGGIKRLLHDDGLTIRGVQKVLREQGIRHVAGLTVPNAPAMPPLPPDQPAGETQTVFAKPARPATPRQTALRNPVAPILDAVVKPAAEALPLWAAAIERIGGRSGDASDREAPQAVPEGGTTEPDIWLPTLLRALPPGLVATRRAELAALQTRLQRLHNRVSDAARHPSA